jgi:hypothetical protein
MLDYLEHRLRMAAASGTPWPTVSAPMTPPRGSCCEQGGQCAADATPWLNPTWRALQFAIPAAHYFTYEYVAMPDGSVLLRAHGDVGCDGKATTHERTITLTAGKVSVTSRSD